MTSVLAASGRHAPLVLERLRVWSQAGYVSPFIWAGADGTVALVVNGAVEPCPMGEALDGRSSDAFVVGVALPNDEGLIGRAALEHVRQTQDALEAAIPGRTASAPAIVFIPVDESTRIERPKEGVVRSAIVVVPEDQAGPHSANRFDPSSDDSIAGHAAHAAACLTGILGSAHERFLAPQPEEMPDAAGTPLSFVRCHSRIIDAGFLTDALAVRAFTSAREGWPNPDRGRFERGGLADDVVETLIDRYLQGHDDVLGLRSVGRLTTPDPPRLPLTAALRAVTRFLISELKRRPYEWFDQRIERLWDGVVVTTVERLGSGSGVHVVRWREQSRDAPPSEFMASQLARSVPAPDGAIGPVWRDLVSLTTSLIDGRELPVRADELVREDRRRLETRPARLVPDPLELPPLDPRPTRACDPAFLGPLIASLVESLTPETGTREDAGALDSSGEGEPSGNGADDPAGPALGALEAARREQVRVWYEERSRTLLWRVGERLAARIKQAESESQGPSSEDWQHLEEGISEIRTLGQRRARRRRRWLFFRTLVAFALATWLVMGNLPTLLKPLAVLALLLVWFALLVTSWWRARSWASQHEREVHQATEQLLHGAVVAATRRGDKERLERRYAEYLDWAEVLGHLIHRPWLARATPYGRPEDLQAPPDLQTLPAACKLGYALFSDAKLRRISAVGEAAVFRVGWLSDVVDDIIERAARDWLELHPSRDSDAAVAPDPFGDRSADPENIRAYVVEFVRLGRARSIEHSRLVTEYAERIAQEPVSSVLAEVVDAATSSDVPLPPAAEWFSSPRGLDRLASQVRELIVSITTSTAAGSTWRGSGVLVDNAGLVATCRHCVETDEGSSFAITTVDGRTFPAEVVAAADDADVAVIRAKTDVSFPAAMLGATVDLVQGAPIFTLGYPFFSHETGGPSLAWGAVTAARRDVEGDRGSLETRVQTNYPAGGGASGSPVFNLNGEVIGIHTGGYSEHGTEERSSHVSFAVPVERLIRLIKEALGAEPVALPSESAAAVAAGVAPATLREFLDPLLVASEAYLGAYGALSTKARRVMSVHVSPAEAALVADQLPLGQAAVQPIRVGEPVRVAAIRVDQTDVFHIGRRAGTAERLPWFATAAGNDLEEELAASTLGSEADPEDGLASL